MTADWAALAPTVVWNMSFLLGHARSEPDELRLWVDLALARSSPLWRPPAKGEVACYVAGALAFSGCRRIEGLHAADARPRWNSRHGDWVEATEIFSYEATGGCVRIAAGESDWVVEVDAKAITFREGDVPRVG